MSIKIMRMFDNLKTKDRTLKAFLKTNYGYGKHNGTSICPGTRRIAENLSVSIRYVPKLRKRAIQSGLYVLVKPETNKYPAHYRIDIDQLELYVKQQTDIDQIILFVDIYSKPVDNLVNLNSRPELSSPPDLNSVASRPELSSVNLEEDLEDHLAVKLLYVGNEKSVDNSKAEPVKISLLRRIETLESILSLKERYETVELHRRLVEETILKPLELAA